MQHRLDYLINQKRAGRTLIFDLDDTIFSELDFLKQQYLKLAQAFAPDFSESAYNFLVEDFLKFGRKNIFKRFRLKFNLVEHDEELLLVFRDYSGDDLKVLRHRRWFAELVSHYTESEALLIITNGYVPQQKEKLRRLALEALRPQLFVVYASEYEPKPARASFEFLSREIHLHEPIYIGDSKVDEEFSKRCSMEFCWTP